MEKKQGEILKSTNRNKYSSHLQDFILYQKKLLTKKSVLNYLKRLLSSEALTLGQKKKKLLFRRYWPGKKLFFLMMWLGNATCHVYLH